MKKPKFEIIFETVAELVLSLICLAAGYGILSAFGEGGTLLESDPDLLMLIGIIAIAVVAGISAALFALFKRLKAKGGKEKITDTEPDGERDAYETE